MSCPGPAANPDRPILVVDDEEQAILDMTRKLSSEGLQNVIGCADSRQALGLARSRQPSLVLLDLQMPHLSGEKLLDELHAEFPLLPVIVVTVTDQVSIAVSCMQAGAFDYMVKPVEDARLLSGVRRALELRRLQKDYRHLKEKLLTDRLANPEPFAPLLTRSRAMLAVFQYVETVARNAEPILLVGETGVGKNLLARAIHEASGRSGELVEVNVAGLDDDKFADTLFGHSKGAFTGVPDMRPGRIQQADGGTVLLDEIGDLSLASQTKLLDLLDTGKYYPLGSDLPRRTEARFLMASNRDLQELVRAEKFRLDLYFRLSTYSIRIPPLRERPEDLPLLLTHFLEAAALRANREPPAVPSGLLNLLARYDFPGNVRELDSLVRDALARTVSNELSAAPFQERTGKSLISHTAQPAAAGLALPERLPTLRQAAESLIAEALRRANGNQSVAAAWLGISHQALSKRLKNRQPAQE
jgi:DNA-binding NtrC family response regulator